MEKCWVELASRRGLARCRSARRQGSNGRAWRAASKARRGEARRGERNTTGQVEACCGKQVWNSSWPRGGFEVKSELVGALLKGTFVSEAGRRLINEVAQARKGGSSCEKDQTAPSAKRTDGAKRSRWLRLGI